MNLTAPSLCQSADQRYAGIGCQLHPLKAKDLMMDKVIRIERIHKIQVYAYQSKIVELTNSNIPLLCQSGHRGYTGISRQLHPLEAKIKLWQQFHRSVYMRHPIAIGGPSGLV